MFFFIYAFLPFYIVLVLVYDSRIFTELSIRKCRYLLTDLIIWTLFLLHSGGVSKRDPSDGVAGRDQ